MSLCICGCGKPTKIISKTSIKDGRIKGEYNKYIHGHHIKILGESIEKKRIRMQKDNPMHKLSDAKKNEWRHKLSLGRLGKVPWNKGIKRIDIAGEKHPKWCGGKSIAGGYISILLPNGRRIKEHQLIMQNYLHRHLKPGEVIHHINGRRDDNRIENLELMNAKEHIKKYHSIQSNKKRIRENRLASSKN